MVVWKECNSSRFGVGVGVGVVPFFVFFFWGSVLSLRASEGI